MHAGLSVQCSTGHAQICNSLGTPLHTEPQLMLKDVMCNVCARKICVDMHHVLCLRCAPRDTEGAEQGLLEHGEVERTHIVTDVEHVPEPGLQLNPEGSSQGPQQDVVPYVFGAENVRGCGIEHNDDGGLVNFPDGSKPIHLGRRVSFFRQNSHSVACVPGMGKVGLRACRCCLSHHHCHC